MKFLSVLSRVRKGIRYILENHKKELLTGLLILMFLVAVVAAAVYNFMHLQGTVGVEPTPTS